MLSVLIPEAQSGVKVEINWLLIQSYSQAVQKCLDARPPKSRRPRRTWAYDADGHFSTACQASALVSLGSRISLWPHSLQYFEWMLFSVWQRSQMLILCNQMVLIKWKTIEVINAEKVHTATNIQVSSEMINFLSNKDTK